jgi:hypothetical protein
MEGTRGVTDAQMEGRGLSVTFRILRLSSPPNQSTPSMALILECLNVARFSVCDTWQFCLHRLRYNPTNCGICTWAFARRVDATEAGAQDGSSLAT